MSEDERLQREEDLILEATEVICELMDREGVSRGELARRIECSSSFVSQTLNGDRPMSIRTLAKMAYVLDYRVRIGYLVRERENAPTERRSASSGA